MPDDGIRLKVKLLYQYAVTLFFTIICYGGIYLFFFRTPNIAACCALSGSLCLLTPLVYRLTRSVSLAIGYLIVSSISIAVFTAIYTGGTRSPVLFWITVIPLVGSLLTRQRWSSLKWFVISLLCFLIVWSREKVFGSLPSEVKMEDMGFVHNFALFGISLVNVIFTQLFESKLSIENVKIDSKNKELELALEKLQKAQGDLIRSEKMALLGTMSASISHELNNSLNFVSGVLSPMEKLLNRIDEFEDKNKILKLFDVMKNGVNLSVDIIENLKSYSTNDSESIEEVNISKIVNTVTSILKSRIPEYIQVITDVPKAFTTMGNYAGLNQLIMNLFKNSLDAVVNEGKVFIRVIVAKEYWELEVEDSGEGIPQENLNRILDPFFSTKVAGKGTGLGLFVVQKEVNRHRGELKIESQLGKGTKVMVRFPIVGGSRMESSR